MLAITCFSYPLPLTEGLDQLARGPDLDITGSKTVGNELQEIKIDVCLTALLLLPLFFIPNLIQKEKEDVRTQVRFLEEFFNIYQDNLDSPRAQRAESLHRHSSPSNSTNTSVSLAASPASPASPTCPGPAPAPAPVPASS